jgi:hypothetical protein
MFIVASVYQIFTSPNTNGLLCPRFFNCNPGTMMRVMLLVTAVVVVYLPTAGACGKWAMSSPAHPLASNAFKPAYGDYPALYEVRLIHPVASNHHH